MKIADVFHRLIDKIPWFDETERAAAHEAVNENFGRATEADPATQVTDDETVQADAPSGDAAPADEPVEQTEAPPDPRSAAAQEGEGTQVQDTATDEPSAEELAAFREWQASQKAATDENAEQTAP